MNSCINVSVIKALQQQLKRIECKLDNPRTGLGEIKSEVAVIEGAVTNPCFGLKRIAEGVEDIEDFLCDIKPEKLDELLEDIRDEVRRIECKLDNPEFGLEEIKEEVADIEDMVKAIKCILKDLDLGDLEEIVEGIADEVQRIECKLDNPEFGLEEIKEEVRDIEDTVKDIKDLLKEPDVEDIEDLLEAIKDLLRSPEFGLEEIKEEVKAIECVLRDLDLKDILCLLARIKAEVCQIEDKLDNPCYGLAEIKEEVKELLEMNGPTCNGGNDKHEPEVVTSGPMFRANQASSAIAQVLNYSDDDVTVTIRVFDVSLTGSKTQVSGSPTTVVVDPDESFAKAFDISDSVSYEVQFETQDPKWVRYWSGSRTQPATTALTSTTLVPENIVLHEDFVAAPLSRRIYQA